MKKVKRFHGLVTSVKIIICTGVLLNIAGCYLLKQGRYLLHYQRKAEKIAKVLERDSLPDNIRSLLVLANEIKKFSVDKIGLIEDDNFSTYLETDKKNIVYVVSASESDSFEKYEWRFPFFGSFPYKGFFKKEDARKTAQKLRKKGYDVYVRGAGAYSTLGFFTDPIYSYMMEYSIFDLASIIIHEQTHATKFLKNQIQFNEEMASFVGDEGALFFIREKYGIHSDQYNNAILKQKDYETFITFLKTLYGELSDLYSDTLLKETMLKKKKSIIATYQSRFERDYDSLFTTKAYKKFSTREVNNAYLNSYMTYTCDLGDFYALYKKNGLSLWETVSQLKTIDRKEKHPKKYIQDVLLKR